MTHEFLRDRDAILRELREALQRLGARGAEAAHAFRRLEPLLVIRGRWLCAWDCQCNYVARRKRELPETCPLHGQARQFVMPLDGEPMACGLRTPPESPTMSVMPEG